MSKFEKHIKKITEILGMGVQEDDVAYAILSLVVNRSLDWRKLFSDDCQQSCKEAADGK